MKIIQQRQKFFVLSAILVIASIVMLIVWGLKPGIDFRGGVLTEIKFTEKLPDKTEFQSKLQELNLDDLTIQVSGADKMLVRFISDDDAINTKVQEKIKSEYKDAVIEQTAFISSAISKELKSRAIQATVIAIIGIMIYIMWAFRKVSYPVESWKYGLGAVIALAHDIIITLGVFAWLGHYYGVEVNIPFIAALLTILGYSVNDTIVIFDRIRENLNRAEAKKNFEDTVNRSINESMSRSLNTSLTVVVVLLAIIFFGGNSIKYFAVALLVGIVAGTYSSIFVASAILVEAWKRKLKRS
jgi:preprotein translocase subunit SecF